MSIAVTARILWHNPDSWLKQGVGALWSAVAG
jgi:hypothetical protein